MKLVLGVNDIPYVGAEGEDNLTVGDVAEFLEKKYGVMNLYVERHGDFIASQLENTITGAIESLEMGAPASLDPFGRAMSAIETDFRKMIETKELDRAGIPGIPTKAALDGVDHRKKSKKGAKGRPSFRDTGLYVNSFRSWIE